MQLCLGTSLAIIVPTTLRSYRAHETRGLVLPNVVRHWALPSMMGVVAGSVLAAIAPAEIFKAAFVVIACAIAAKFLIGGERWVVGTELPGAAAMSSYGFVIGLASSLMGGAWNQRTGGGTSFSGGTADAYPTTSCSPYSD
jgi:uncharacterized membrane protein YfcA